MSTIEAVHEFQSLALTRHDSAGAAGAQHLYVDPDMKAWIGNSATGDVHHVELDAAAAEQLIEAMRGFTAGDTATSSVAPEGMPQYDLALAWGNSEYRVHSSQLSADEALHGVLEVANGILDGATVQAVRVENGNPGVVPPWLQSQMVIDPAQPVAPGDDTPRIMGGVSTNLWDPSKKPITSDPDMPHIMGNDTAVYDPDRKPITNDPDVPRIMGNDTAVYDPDRKPITNDPDVPRIMGNDTAVYDPDRKPITNDPDVPRIMDQPNG